jgi:hypothetical protein
MSYSVKHGKLEKSAATVAKAAKRPAAATRYKAKREKNTAIAAKVATTMMVPGTVTRKVNWPDQTPGGYPQHTMTNAQYAIHQLKLDCKLDVFRNRYTINGTALGGFVGDLSDKVTRKIRDMSRTHLSLDPGKEAMADAVQRECEEHQYNPLRDKLTKLVWDGEDRLSTWLTVYLGVEDSPLVQAQSEIVLLAAVARAFAESGKSVKFDHVLVLEGPEGIRKSTAVKVLASGSHNSNDYFSDSPILASDERKQKELTAGIWFYELGEMAGLSKTDQLKLKTFITSEEERARDAYDKFHTVQPRICIFIGSFNTDANTGGLVEYLNPGDQRRWWPVLCTYIDIEALERDRDQLLAQAVSIYYDSLCDPVLYLPKDLEDEAKAIAKTRGKTDTLISTLEGLAANIEMMATKRDYMGGKITTSPGDDGGVFLILPDEALPFAHVNAEGIATWVAARYVLTLVPASRKSDGRGITAAMRELGWEIIQDRRSGEKVRGYTR